MDQKVGQEIADRGEKIYQEHIRALVDPSEYGKFVVIDVDSGDYEIDRSDPAATRRLLDRQPDAITYAVRVGRPSAYRMVGMKIRKSAS